MEEQKQLELNSNVNKHKTYFNMEDEEVFIMECMDQLCDENADGYTQTLALEECTLRWSNKKNETV